MPLPALRRTGAGANRQQRISSHNSPLHTIAPGSAHKRKAAPLELPSRRPCGFGLGINRLKTFLDCYLDQRREDRSGNSEVVLDGEIVGLGIASAVLPSYAHLNGAAKMRQGVLELAKLSERHVSALRSRRRESRMSGQVRPRPSPSCMPASKRGNVLSAPPARHWRRLPSAASLGVALEVNCASPRANDALCSKGERWETLGKRAQSFKPKADWPVHSSFGFRLLSPAEHDDETSTRVAQVQRKAERDHITFLPATVNHRISLPARKVRAHALSASRWTVDRPGMRRPPMSLFRFMASRRDLPFDRNKYSASGMGAKLLALHCGYNLEI